MQRSLFSNTVYKNCFSGDVSQQRRIFLKAATFQSGLTVPKPLLAHTGEPNSVSCHSVVLGGWGGVFSRIQMAAPAHTRKRSSRWYQGGGRGGTLWGNMFRLQKFLSGQFLSCLTPSLDAGDWALCFFFFCESIVVVPWYLSAPTSCGAADSSGTSHHGILTLTPPHPTHIHTHPTHPYWISLRTVVFWVSFFLSSSWFHNCSRLFLIMNVRRVGFYIAY